MQKTFSNAFRGNDLHLKVKKCAFDITEIEYLSIIICSNKAAMDSAKLKAILN